MEDGSSHFWSDIALTAMRDVYLPAEDSELLAQEAHRRAYGRVLEIGTGCGLCALACASKLEVREVVATDISAGAIKCARANAQKHNAKIKFYRGNLFAALPKNIGKFDFILFNPPYLPANSSEKVNGKLNFTLDGGKEGIRISSEFIKEAGKFLAPGGTVLMVASTAQNLGKQAQIAKKSGFSHEVCATCNLFFEQLQVWKLKKARQCQIGKTSGASRAVPGWRRPMRPIPARAESSEIDRIGYKGAWRRGELAGHLAWKMERVRECD